MGPTPGVVEVHVPPRALGTLLYDALGGAAAALGALAVMAAASVLGGGALAAGPNAIGAWMVRWLQSAAPDAVHRAYWDATVGGIVTSAVAGGVVGALFGATTSRWRAGNLPLVGVAVGLACWSVVRWVVAPALDPLLVRVFDWRALLLAGVAFGALLGFWARIGRDAL